MEISSTPRRPAGTFAILVLIFVFVLGGMIWVAGKAVAEGFTEPREGLFVKMYTREDLLKTLGDPGGWLSSDRELPDRLGRAGLAAGKGLVDLKDLSFHGKGAFEFVRYSRDGKSLYISYMYPSKEADTGGYMPHVLNRSALTKWDASTGRLTMLWMAEENPAKAVAMSGDDRIVIYHLDLCGQERSKDGSLSIRTLKNQLYSYDLTRDGGEVRRIVSLDKDDDLVVDSYPTLDNIVLSPDSRFLVFSAELRAKPGRGHGLVVDVASGKKTPYQYAYGKGKPGMPNAASHVFSPDGKQLAMSTPKEVDKSGLTKAGINIVDTSSWNTIRQLPVETTTFMLDSAIYSPDGRYLVRHNLNQKKRNQFVRVSTGEVFCAISGGLFSRGFSPDGRFYLDFFPDKYDLSFIDARTCFRLPSVPYTRSFDGGALKAAFSPDGRHIVLAGQARKRNTVQVMDFKVPEDSRINLFRKADRAIELYCGGLKKEGTAMAREVIIADPSGIYDTDYRQRLVDSGMPLFLLGELYRGTYSEASRRKENRFGVSYHDTKEGVAITKINPGTPAESSGLAAGDTITGLNGEKVTGISRFSKAYDGLPPDRPAELTVLRQGNLMRLRIVPTRAIPFRAFAALMEFARTALEAGQPAIAMQALDLIKGWVKEKRIFVNKWMDETFFLTEASALASMGKEGEAFALLVAHNGFEQALPSIWVYPSAFQTLLKDRRKLATAMMVKEIDLPPSPKKVLAPQPYPDLTGKVIEPLGAPPVVAPPQAANTPGRPKTPAPQGPSSPGPAPRGTVLD